MPEGPCLPRLSKNHLHHNRGIEALQNSHSTVETGSSRSTHYFSWQPASVAGQVKSGPGHVGIRRQSASRTGGPAVSSADMLASHQIGHFNTVSAKAFANSASEKLDTHCQNQRERDRALTLLISICMLVRAAVPFPIHIFMSPPAPSH